jgi:hypothetical protein
VVDTNKKVIKTECFNAFECVTLTERIFSVKHFHRTPERENLPFAITIKVGYAETGNRGGGRPELTFDKSAGSLHTDSQQ